MNIGLIFLLIVIGFGVGVFAMWFDKKAVSDQRNNLLERIVQLETALKDEEEKNHEGS